MLIRRYSNGRLGGIADQDEAGFTLIELMVVILIIAILMAIAIPTYLGARNRAENRAAQSDLRNAMTAAVSDYASQGAFQAPPSWPVTYSPFAAYLAHEEPALTFVGASVAVSAINQISETRFKPQGAQSVAFAAHSSNGDCWYLMTIESPSASAIAAAHVPSAGTYYGAGKGAKCLASHSAPTSGWRSSFAKATP